MTATQAARLVDDSTGRDAHNRTLDRIYELRVPRDRAPAERLLVKIHVRCNFYDDQSSATASLFSASRTWTPLLDDPPSNWHAGATSPHAPSNQADRYDDLALVAGKLLARVITTLGAA